MSNRRPPGDASSSFSQQFPVPRTTRHVVDPCVAAPPGAYAVVGYLFVLIFSGLKGTTLAGRPMPSTPEAVPPVMPQARARAQARAPMLRPVRIPQWLRGRGAGLLLPHVAKPVPEAQPRRLGA